MQLIPVIDIQDGLAVRGVAGRRSEYRPIRSQICDSADPVAVASAFRNRFGLNRIYIADLDAIAGKPPAVSLYRSLAALGFQIMVDAGIRTVDNAHAPLANGVETVVAGTETLAGFSELERLLDQYGANRIVFSVDLKQGELIGNPLHWPAAIDRIIDTATMIGCQQFLLLDLARVGVAGGPGSLELAESIRRRHPTVELMLGGGIRNHADLDVLVGMGIAAALVASALHDGAITPNEFAACRRTY